MRRLVPRRKPCHVLGQFGQRRLARLQDLRGFRRLGRSRLQARLVAFGCLGDLALFPLKPLDRLACVAVETRLALQIARKLLDPSLQRLDQLCARAS
jgi:hypothetical protein